MGGTERQMVELLRRLDRREFEVHLACFHRRGALASRAVEHAASIAAFPIDGFGRPSAARQLFAFARWCRRINARIVHTCELYSNIFGLPGAALAGVEVRIGNRRELRTPDKSRAQLAAQGAAYRTAHIVVANSTAAAAQLREEGLPEDKIHMIPNGVDCDAFAAPDRDRPIRSIVTVANLRPEKGHDTLIEAASIIVRSHPDVDFQVIGDGPLRASLVRQVNLRGLRSKFTFLGERPDVPARLAAADLFVLPSRSEACPNGVLEAMASALPVVAARVGGVPELIEGGVNGVLVDADAPDQLASAVCDLVNRPAYARALGRAARATAVERFAFDRMVARFEQLYLSALHERVLSPESGCEPRPSSRSTRAVKV
ncbi:MAG TPA: glycosyltransferase [Vicinamibacterales bacterium]|nr:glycosyltransferase [Vicinamibacterales bacterium]